MEQENRMSLRAGNLMSALIFDGKSWILKHIKLRISGYKTRVKANKPMLNTDTVIKELQADGIPIRQDQLGRDMVKMVVLAHPELFEVINFQYLFEPRKDAPTKEFYYNEDVFKARLCYIYRSCGFKCSNDKG